MSALGAMQAQDYTGALWSIGLRMPNATEAEVERAIKERKIVRSWPMRGTLHFVAATDLRSALVHVRGGEFVMGSPPGEKERDDDEMQHRVRVSSFVMCETEVTQGQYRAVMGTSPSDCGYGCGDALPVQSVSWFDATTYLDLLSTREELRPCYAGRKGEEVSVLYPARKRLEVVHRNDLVLL